MDISALGDYSWFGHLEIPKMDMLSESGWPSSSLKLVKQLPTLSVDPDRKRTAMFIILVDTRLRSRPVGISSYIRCLVIEEDK